MQRNNCILSIIYIDSKNNKINNKIDPESFYDLE